MSYNHAKEEKKFKVEWKRKEKIYRENGMSDEQISAIKEYDESIFKKDRAFYRRTVMFAAPENYADGTKEGHSDTYLEEYWIEFIDDADKYDKLMKIPVQMRKAFYINRVYGIPQKELSSKSLIPERTMRWWFRKIAEILK